MANARSLSQFQEAFSDEASCAAFLFKRRWPEGFVCPACGKRRAAVLKSRPRLHECLDCGRQTSVTAGTVMHRSKLPLTTWFWAAHMMTMRIPTKAPVFNGIMPPGDSGIMAPPCNGMIPPGRRVR